MQKMGRWSLKSLAKIPEITSLLSKLVTHKSIRVSLNPVILVGEYFHRSMIRSSLIIDLIVECFSIHQC